MRLRATYTRTSGVRHMYAALDLASGQMFYRFRDRKRSQEFLGFLRQLRQRFPTGRLFVVCDNFSPHRHHRVGSWCAAHDVELVFTPTHVCWLNWIEAEFTALHYFTLDGSDYPSHAAQETAIAGYVRWHHRHATPKRRFAANSKILLVPIKHLTAAKTGLQVPGGTGTHHDELVLAMAVDTVVAAVRADRVRRVAVLTADAVVADALRQTGVEILLDESTGGLNAALVAAAVRRGSVGPLGVLLAICPRCTSTTWTVLSTRPTGDLRSAPPGRGEERPSYLPGTSTLCRGSSDSVDQHRRLGVLELMSPGPSLRQVVGTWADLFNAAELGLGARTAPVVAASGVPAGAARAGAVSAEASSRGRRRALARPVPAAGEELPDDLPA